MAEVLLVSPPFKGLLREPVAAKKIDISARMFAGLGSSNPVLCKEK